MKENAEYYKHENDCHSALNSPVDENIQKIDQFEVDMNSKLKSLNHSLENSLNFYSRIIRNQAKVQIRKDFQSSKYFKAKLDDLMSFRRFQFEIEYEQHLNYLRDVLKRQIDDMRSEDPDNFMNEIQVDDLKIFYKKSQQIRRNLLIKYKLPLNESSLSRSQTNFSIKSNQSDMSNVFKLPPIDTKELVRL
jgi:hypothetical protein